jgi:SP family sugar:H+ symporter-like MFS transporter
MTTATGTGVNTGLVAAIVAVATIGGFLFGYDSGAVNGTQEGLKAAFSLSEGGLGFTVGSLLIGCFIGAFFAGTLADSLGRRNVMRLAALLFLGGAIVQGIAHDHTLFLIARSSAAWPSAPRRCCRRRTSPRSRPRTSAAG